MAASPLFDRVAEELEQRSGLDRLSARGTLRIALKQAGFDAASIAAPQLAAVLRRVLPAELASRGVADAPALCERVAAGLPSAGDAAAPGGDSVTAIFRRLGGA